MTPTVRQVRPLLDLIQKKEAPKGFNQVWGGIKSRHHPPKLLTDMTVREVLAWQDSIDHLYMSEAAGGFQILEDTLRRTYAPAGLSPNDKFTKEAQEAVAVYLMKEQGLTEFLRGDMTPETFANRVARVWASLPLVSGPHKGKGVYDGDGLNKALVSVQEYMSAVRSVLAPPADYVRRKPQSRWSWLSAALRWFLSLFRKGRSNE